MCYFVLRRSFRVGLIALNFGSLDLAILFSYILVIQSFPRIMAYVRDRFVANKQGRFECGCCETQVMKVRGAVQNFYISCLYNNPDLDDRIFDLLLRVKARIHDANHRFFLWVIYTLIIGSSLILLERIVTRWQTSIFVHFPLVDGGTLDLLMTDVPASQVWLA